MTAGLSPQGATLRTFVVFPHALPTIFAAGCQNNRIPAYDFVLNSAFPNDMSPLGMEFPFLCRTARLLVVLMTPTALILSAGSRSIDDFTRTR